MDAPLSMNTLRIVLVGLTALAALVSFFLGQVLVGVVLTFACAMHGGIWVVLRRQRETEHDDLHAGIEALLHEDA